MTTKIPVLSDDILRRIDDLRATCPYDGRRVVLMENRGGWKWSGIRGTCTRIAADRSSMVISVDYCPDDYWPVGMEILADLDRETMPHFLPLEN